TVNAGVKYAMPFYKKLSVRGTFMYHTDTRFHFLEGRVGLTILPVNWFCLTGNVGYNTYGATWGAGVTLNVAILNIHAGIESYMGQVTKPYAIAIKDQPLPVKLSLPLNGSRYLATIGLSVTIGHSQNAHATPKREKKVKASKVKTKGQTMEIVE
ncbi:MAG: hypothetical protein MJY62_06140, partial [Bacteroidales bacterium]|nr:hypothetical protein [Bacteroidales bacterium]